MKSDLIWMDGEFKPYEQATVHFLSPSLHYGMAVFEGIRCYQTPRGPAVFRLREHLQRFIESIHILGIQDFPYSVEMLRQETKGDRLLSVIIERGKAALADHLRAFGGQAG